MRVAKVNLETGELFDLGMEPHLTPLVPGQGLAQLGWYRCRLGDQRVAELGRFPTFRQVNELQVPCLAIDQRADR